jgi:hypothetical protein
VIQVLRRRLLKDSGINAAWQDILMLKVHVGQQQSREQHPVLLLMLPLQTVGILAAVAVATKISR